MRRYLITLSIAFICTGCTASYDVSVNGYSSTGQSLTIPEGSSFDLLTEDDVPNPIFQKEVGNSIRKILKSKGYTDTSEQPNYYLYFDYGIDSGRTITDAIPIYHRGYYYRHKYPYYYSHDYVKYIPYSSVIHNRWLLLKLFDGKAYPESPETEPLWICEITSTGSESDLREIITYMLVAAFEHFGRDTGRQLTEIVRRNDERVLELIEK